MSVDLANASHYSVNDASQGFSVWTEDMPGVADNWYFVMPNLHGVSVDGKSFNGVAGKICHDTTFFWVGHIIRHCTSRSRPDGLGTNVVGSANGMVNHLYCTCTCAKERLVNTGRTWAKMTQEMKEFANTDEERVRVLRQDEESWWDEDKLGRSDPKITFAPTIKDADPDHNPVPKDGCQITWLGWYWQLMREKDEAGKRTPNKFYNLVFDRYPGDNEEQQQRHKQKQPRCKNCKEEAESLALLSLPQSILHLQLHRGMMAICPCRSH
jgi:hypothetical protein